MELLAPAGSLESLKAAIYAGADAVYLGGKRFNARQGATNFSLDELKSATKLAHDYDVKIYLTVNTLTHEAELKEMGDYLCEVANNCNIDAFIVQDLGVAKLAHAIAPNIELHASTQMTIHSTQALPLLLENNFKRVVLAREVSLESIKEMSEKYPQIGLEIFAHGALCYAYSGQCLMSSLIGGRSGNRGACAGPCRLPYTLMRDGVPLKTKGNYLMSPKDLCLIDSLAELKNHGASAIKIEGRLKRPDYVYTVVSSYRKALNEGENYRLSKDDTYQLKQAFNRGFTKGLIFAQKGDKLMNIDRPDNRGVEVAVVKDCYKGRLKIKCLTSLEKGDILAWHTGNKSQTLKLPKAYQEGAMIQVKTTEQVKIGTKVSRVVSIVQQRNTTEAMRRPVAKFGLELHAKLIEGNKFELTGIDSKGYQATVTGDNDLELAENKAATPEYVSSQLGKLGGTLWYLTDCNVIIKGKPAIRASELNKCRRELIEKLTQMRRDKQSVNSNPNCQAQVLEQLAYQKHLIKREQISPKLAVTTQTISEVKAALNSGADLVYLGGVEWNNLTLGDLEPIIKNDINRIVLRLPRISTNQDFKKLIEMYKQFKILGVNKVMLDNLGQLAYLKQFTDIELISGSGIPVFNCLTIEQLKASGISQVTISPELNYQQMQQIACLSTLPLEVIVHGRLLLMVHESCLLSGLTNCSDPCHSHEWSLKDRKDYCFPLKVDNRHRSYLYNCQDLALFNKIPELLVLKPAVLRIEGAGRGTEYIINVIKAYQQILQNIQNGGQIDFEKVQFELRNYSKAGLTRAHWQRGV